MLTMLYRSLALAIVCALAAGGTARAAAPTKPLRTLVYSVQYSAQNRNDEQTSGFTGNGGGPGTAGGMVTRTSDVGDDGTLTVEVIAATPDGGLVVDATYTGKTTVQPKLRIAIFSDGRLSADPHATVSVETAYLLPLLARGLVAGRDVSPGSAWTVPAAPGTKGDWSYKVTGVDGDVATLAIATTRTVAGPRGYDESDTATTRYDTARLCPLSYDLNATSRHSVGTSQYVSTNARLTASLVSDTFANH
jgi:hypothetical protein